MDATGDPDWADTLSLAADRAAPTGSRPITGPLDEPAMIVAVPLPSHPNAEPSEVVGFLSLVVDLDDLAAALTERLPTGASLQVIDGDDTVVHLGEEASSPVEAEVTVAGRRWTVQGPSSSISPWGTPMAAILAAGVLLSAVVGGAGAHRLIQHRRLDETRARLARLQEATAGLARTRFPDAVWSVTVRSAAQILQVPSAVAVIDRGDSTAVIASTDETLANRLDGLERSPGTTLTDRILEGLGPESDRWWCLEVLDVPSPIDGAVIVASRDRRCRDEDRSVCETFLAVAAAALRRAAYHELEHHMAESLREQLQDMVAPSHRIGLEVIHRPHDLDSGIGGDWYDLVERDDGVVVVSIGDVVGHGIAAAGPSGQLRTAMRALAPFTSPAECLQSLGELSLSIPNAELATALSLHLHLDDMTAVYSAAGHPPPLLVRDLEAEPLLGGRGVPLGLRDGSPRTDATVTLRDGDHLVLFTDGVVERRDRPWDEGVALLSGIIVDHLAGRIASLSDEIHTRLLDGASDDVTVLILAVGDHRASEV